MPRRAKWRELFAVFRLPEGNLVFHMEGREAIEIEDTKVRWEFREDMEIPHVFIKREGNRFGPIVYVKVSGQKEKIRKILSEVGITLP